MDLSLCIIVKNEESTLPLTLNSVKEVVDEMIVVDTGSRDRTPEIAREFGAKVYNFEWCNDFAAARNECLKYATGKWILVLDADEVLVPDIIPQLQQAIKNDRHLLINLIRQEVGATQSPYSLVSRLFRNHPQIRFSRPYHAMVDDSISDIITWELQWKIVSLPRVAILHSGYKAGAIAAKNKLQKAQSAMESYLAQHPSDAYVCSKLGALYVTIGEIEQGMKLLKRGLTVASVDVNVLYELHYHLGIAYRQQQDLTKAKEHYQAALKLDIVPQLKLGAYNNLGNLLKDEGNLLGAKSLYETALQLDPNFATGYYNLGMTLKALGNFGDAIAAYQQAINFNPDAAETYQNLGVVLLKIGKVAESLEVFKKAIALHEVNNPEEAKRLREGLREMSLI